jgi:hypothetical protein
VATPRKNWSRLFDQVLRMGWPDAVLADFIRLQAFLNERWARDGLTPEEAGDALLSPQQCMLVTCTQNPRSARRRLLALPSSTPMGAFDAHEEQTGRALWVKVRWEKFAESQEYQDRGRPDPGNSRGRDAPEPSPSETRQDKTRRNGGGGLERVGTIIANHDLPGSTGAPEDLNNEQKDSLRLWVRERYQDIDSMEKLQRQIDSCLAHYRAKGTRAVDWEAKCRVWIARQADYDAR